jgi:hypothetical protein
VLKGDPGLSAYEIAVNNGFVGDEKTWLKSLQPYIGENGNWYVGEEDTGVTATPSISYDTLTDTPTINGAELKGDLDISDIGITSMTNSDVDTLFEKEENE